MNVKGVVSIFTYGFDEANENFKRNNTDYIALCDYKTLLQQATEKKYISENDLEILEAWRKNPKNWKQNDNI
jgi:orotate phosphoribosyltransferase